MFLSLSTDALECLPGPLGGHCHQEDSSSNSNTSSESSSNTSSESSSNTSSNTSSESSSSSSSESTWSSSSSTDDAAVDEGRKWTNWFNGGSGVNDGNNDDTQNNGARISNRGSFPWLISIFAVVGLAFGGAYVVYQSVSDK